MNLRNFIFVVKLKCYGLYFRCATRLNQFSNTCLYTFLILFLLINQVCVSNSPSKNKSQDMNIDHTYLSIAHYQIDINNEQCRIKNCRYNTWLCHQYNEIRLCSLSSRWSVFAVRRIICQHVSVQDNSSNIETSHDQHHVKKIYTLYISHTGVILYRI